MNINKETIITQKKDLEDNISLLEENVRSMKRELLLINNRSIKTQNRILNLRVHSMDLNP